MSVEGILNREKKEERKDDEFHEPINSNLRDLMNIGEYTNVQINSFKNKVSSLDNAAIFYKNGLKVTISKIRTDLYFITYCYNSRESAEIETTIDKVITEVRRKYNTIN